MKTLTHTQLLELIKNKPGAYPVGILSVGDAGARKKNNPFGKIFELRRSVAFVGASYQKTVENEAARQGESAEDFQAAKLPYGSYVVKNKIIEHNGELYLRTLSTPGQRRTQPARILMYLTENGQPVEKKQIEKFLPAERESAKQQDDAGLVKTVHPRNYKFSNIKRIRINGETFLVK